MIKDICKKCKQCCNGTGAPHLSIREFNKLNEKYNIDCYRENDSLICLPYNDKCFFNEGNGCILSEEDKPLSCKLFPFKPTDDGWILRLKCPFWYLFDKDDFVNAFNDFKKYRQEWVQDAKKIK